MATANLSIVIDEAFSVYAEGPFETIIKEGIHSIFTVNIERSGLEEAQVKDDIVNALEILSNVDPDIEVDEDDHYSVFEGEPIQLSFFSNIQGGRVEFFARSDGKYDFKVSEAEEVKFTRPPSTKQTLSNIFQAAALESINAVDLKEIEKMVILGVLKTLSEREIYEGEFKKVFTENHALFGKLARVYQEESVASLKVDKGPASVWFAVDEAIEKYE